MAFHVYNSLTRQKELFEPIEEGKVRMYNCGPTVYGRAHIGNMRSYLFADILRRWMEFLGYDVTQIMNITDVGHMQGDDEDAGEDKMDVQARKENRTPLEISQEFTAYFMEDKAALGILDAKVYPRATEHIEEMLEMIDGLIEKGYAYRVADNVYFDVQKFEPYGRLSGNRVEDLDAGARIAINEEKRHPADFALWKSDPQHLMKWSTHFGEHGFPGWHIECSAMARRHLGDEIDIHTGGEDNVFPHHECEIAQTEAFTGRPFARYWMHARFLQVDGGKMSKSLGNVYTIPDIVERGYEPRHLRFALIRGHYRQPLNFTWEILEESRTALENLDRFVTELREWIDDGSGTQDGSAMLEEARSKFVEAMNDDLGTPEAFSALFTLRRNALSGGGLNAESAAATLKFLEETHRVLGVMRFEADSIDDDIEALIEARNAARAAKDWGEADRIRDQLLEQGIELVDQAGVTKWRRK